MSRRTLAKRSFQLKGNVARQFLAAIMPDDQLKEQLQNKSLAPEMRDAVVAEATARDLVPGNFQI